MVVVVATGCIFSTMESSWTLLAVGDNNTVAFETDIELSGTSSYPYPNAVLKDDEDKGGSDGERGGGSMTISGSLDKR